MNRKIFFTILCVFVLLFSAACQPKKAETPAPTQAQAAQTTDLTQEQVLTIGVVSDAPAGTIESFQPFVDYLVKQLNDPGIVKGDVIVTPDLNAMVEKLKSGEVDLFYESPYGALYTYENAGAVPLLVGWRKGVGEYHALIMVRKDSGITSLDGLKGQLIAFADPGSTTGYFLPKAYLITSGFNLSEQSGTASIAADNIGYFFAGSAENMVNAILLGKAVGGAEESAVYDELAQEDKDKLTILAQTEDVPRSLILASSTMSSNLRDRIIAVLKDANNNDEGTAALKGAKKTAKFGDFPLGAQATMDLLKELFAPVK
jgi:phosphonate transport system substrate-binding protein